MRRVILGVLGLAMMATAGGCIGIAATDNSQEIRGGSEVVTVEGRVYVINKQTGEARLVDLASAKPYQADESAEVQGTE